MKKDLRIQKTYHALINAFLELIQIKPLKDISIQELCDHAFIRRATFYHHFKNKHAFIQFVMNHFVKEIFPHDFIQQVLSDTSKLTSEDTYRKYISLVFYFIDTHKQLLDSLIESHTLPEVIDDFSNNLVYFYQKYLKHKDHLANTLHGMDPNLLAHYISGGLITSLKWAFISSNEANADRKRTINQIAHIVYKLLN